MQNLRLSKRCSGVRLYFLAQPTERNDKQIGNTEQTAWSYGLRLRAISADHGDRMRARRGQVVIMTGDGEGGAAVLGHHADGTPQGLQVLWGDVDLPTDGSMWAGGASGGCVCSPR